MSEFCEKKGIKREFSIAKTPQQNGVTERRNRTLIEADRIMLADSKLPTTFWAEAVNTAYYVQNRLLVVKPHNKTPYELFRGRTPALSFMRPFRCHVTILNTLDHLGKFNGKSDDGFFVGYSLNKSMNYVPVVAGTNSNVSADGSLFNSSSKNASNDEPQPSNDTRKKNDDSEIDNQKRPEKNTQDVNTVGPSINTASTNDNIGSLNINTGIPTVNTTPLEDTYADFFGDETEVDMSNISTTYPVSSTQNTRIHKDHSLAQVIGDIQSSVETRRMINEQGFISAVYEGKTHEDLHNCLFTCSLSQEEPKKRAIGTKRVYRNKKDERGIVIRNKARLVTQGYNQEEGIDYDEVFAPVAKIKAIRLFLAYASFKDFVVYQMDVKSAFLYGKIEEGVYVCQPLGFEDPKFPDKVYKQVDVHLYRLMIRSFLYLTASRPDIMFVVCACTRFQVTPKGLHLHAVKRIFRYLKGQPKLGLWYPKESPFDLEAYTDSDYAGASLDRKSTTRGCQFLGSRLISLQCMKQTIVATSTTKVEYVGAASCYRQVRWIQNQMLDYGYNFKNTKIFIDNESIICIVKNPVFHSKTKHIEIRHRFIRDSNEKKLIQMIKIHTYLNVADLLTKAFDVGRFQYLIARIGMLNL
ncbi:putative ribonuclease H-like domain-containing protein [Tanacetum coccineum]|uniref:Ribonuclease H-like domain-containing protein n=1 Tax=Tanacetum coccineum TaxID=301880 RepID=A0ABQ5AH63_9ASTR